MSRPICFLAPVIGWARFWEVHAAAKSVLPAEHHESCPVRKAGAWWWSDTQAGCEGLHIPYGLICVPDDSPLGRATP